jgi:hypothetical protein
VLVGRLVGSAMSMDASRTSKTYVPLRNQIRHQVNLLKTSGLNDQRGTLGSSQINSIIRVDVFLSLAPVEKKDSFF